MGVDYQAVLEVKNDTTSLDRCNITLMCVMKLEDHVYPDSEKHEIQIGKLLSVHMALLSSLTCA